MKKIYYMMLLALVSMTMVSCHDWDSPYYVDNIVGSWVSYYGRDYMGDYDLVGYDVVRYDFYRDHTGRYTYYSYYGLDYVDFEWNTSGDRLFIYYYDGTSDYLFYGFDRNGDLILATGQPLLPVHCLSSRRHVLWARCTSRMVQARRQEDMDKAQ